MGGMQTLEWASRFEKSQCSHSNSFFIQTFSSKYCIHEIGRQAIMEIQIGRVVIIMEVSKSQKEV